MKDEAVLHNVRILDFTWVLAGPYGTRLLADFGAEVIKVQPLLSSEADDTLAQGYYATWNRNKLGITLDLNKPEGIAIVERLVGVCDAVVENFTPRVMANWGLDYRNLKKIKPDIIVVSMSAMGQKGRGRNYTSFAPTVYALSGMTYLTSFPGKPPSGPGFAYADHVAGLYASSELLGALEYRRRTGRGQHIDISEVLVMKNLLIDLTDDEHPEPEGNHSPQAAPHNVYKCKGENRWCAIVVFTEEEWRGLKKAIGQPDWAENKKFGTLRGRKDNETELDIRISAWTCKHTPEELMNLLQEQGIASGIVQDAFDLFIDPQLKTRKFFVASKSEEYSLTDASPVRMDRVGAEYIKTAPIQGEDNNYVYGKLLGMPRKEIEKLRKKGVI